MFTTSRNDFEMNKVFMITVKRNTFKSAYTQCVLTSILCNEMRVSSQLYIFGKIPVQFHYKENPTSTGEIRSQTKKTNNVTSDNFIKIRHPGDTIWDAGLLRAER